MDFLSPQHFSDQLLRFMQRESISSRRFALVLGCPEATIDRLLADQSHPSEEMMRQVAIAIGVGCKRFSKLSKDQRCSAADLLAPAGSGTIGLASITTAIGSLGTTAGLSAAGISSGLSAMGAWWPAAWRHGGRCGGGSSHPYWGRGRRLRHAPRHAHPQAAPTSEITPA